MDNYLSDFIEYYLGSGFIAGLGRGEYSHRLGCNQRLSVRLQHQEVGDMIRTPNSVTTTHQKYGVNTVIIGLVCISSNFT